MLKFNNKEIDSVYYNGKKLEKVFFNNKLVYESTQYIDKPTVSGAYTFNSTNQSAAVSGFNADQMEQSGTVTAKSAGTYTVKFSLKKGFAWLDGSTDDVSYTWTIGKRSITIPTLSITSFDWVEGTTHSTGVKNLDSTYVNQSGATSQTDTGSNIGAKNTVTWTLKYPNDTTWSDGTTTNKSASWSANWKNGTSHYKNDLYNRGWNGGLLIYARYQDEQYSTFDFGGANQPYIKIMHDSHTHYQHLSSLYVNNSDYLLNTRWEVESPSGAEISVDTSMLIKNTIATKKLGRHSYTNAEATAKTTTSALIYGNAKGEEDQSSYVPCFRLLTAANAECHITRIYHT